MNHDIVVTDKKVIFRERFELQKHELSPEKMITEEKQKSSMDIYNLERVYQRELEKLGSLEEEKKKKLEEFLKWTELNGISLVQRIKYLQSLRSFFFSCNKKIEEVSQEDIIKWLENLKVKAKTKKIRFYCVKKFFEFCNRKDVFSNLKIRFICQEKLPIILTEDEVKKVVELLPYAYDRAFFALLYESGARISEFVKIDKNDVQFDEHGAVIILRGKTGERRIRIKKYVEWLRMLFQFRDKPFAISYGKIRKIFEKASEILGRKVHPHLLRHSRATHLAKYLTEAQLKAYFGWTQNSEMTKIYVHLSGRDIDEAILRIPE